MALGSLIGFALLFIAVSWSLSLTSGFLVWLGRSALRRAGASSERTAASSALLLPGCLAAVVAAVILSQSFAVEHHCLAHGHHPHLCLYHGGPWADVGWAVLLVFLLGVTFFARLTERIRSAWNAVRARRTLERTAQKDDEHDIFIAPASSVFCFVTGLMRPRIFMSTRAWDKLDAAERHAVVAHERAHIAQGDLWRRFILSLVALLGVPVLTEWLLDMWKQATEKLCDRRSAATVGDGAVAAALLKLARGETQEAIALANAFTPAANTVERIEALLRGDADRLSAARVLRGVMTVITVAAVLFVIGHADPLHHSLETLLGAV